MLSLIFKGEYGAIPAMVSLNWRTTVQDDATFITAILDNRRQISGVEAHLATISVDFSGKLHRPQSGPIQQWNHEQDTFQVRIPVNERTGVGIVGTGADSSPTLSVTSVAPASDDFDDSSPTRSELIHRLADPRPTRDAVDDSSLLAAECQFNHADGDPSACDVQKVPRELQQWATEIESRAGDGPQAQQVADEIQVNAVRQRSKTLLEQIEASNP